MSGKKHPLRRGRQAGPQTLEAARGSFATFSSDFLSRQQRAAFFLSRIIPTLEGVSTINQQLGRVPTSQHLVIGNRATMKPLNNTGDVVSEYYAGSFAADFVTPPTDRQPPHAVRPAYQRMQALWGPFTSELVHAMNSSENLGNFAPWIPELYVAYTAMSHLVDRNDPHVTLPGGKVDPDYLTKRLP